MEKVITLIKEIIRLLKAEFYKKTLLSSIISIVFVCAFSTFFLWVLRIYITDISQFLDRCLAVYSLFPILLIGVLNGIFVYSDEHKYGMKEYLYLQPVKRANIFLSKAIYVLILNLLAMLFFIFCMFILRIILTIEFSLYIPFNLGDIAVSSLLLLISSVPVVLFHLCLSNLNINKLINLAVLIVFVCVSNNYKIKWFNPYSFPSSIQNGAVDVDFWFSPQNIYFVLIMSIITSVILFVGNCFCIHKKK